MPTSPRVPVLVANWKMHKTVHETIAYVRELTALVHGVHGIELAVAPPFTSLAAAVETARNTSVGVTSQNVAVEREGAFTGEVSALMVKDAGADYSLVGHSERRRLYGDTDAVVQRKLQACRAAGLTPILCIGELIEERNAGQTTAVLDRQLKAALDELAGDAVSRVIIAYEPVWAIGTGRNATPAEAEDAHAHIRARLRQWFGGATADACRILCGGSVRPDTVEDLIALPDVDGALVGSASLDVREFFDVIRRVKT